MRLLIQPLFIAMICAFLGPFVIAQDAKPRRSPQPLVEYPLDEDSKIDGELQGKLEGPFLFKSKILENTIRKYWVYVPPQYNVEVPAAVLVFQDGARAINPKGNLRVPNVLENLIAKEEIPVTIGIFITPGQRGEEFPDSIGTGNPDNRDREYDVLDDKYTRFVLEEILPEVGESYKLSQDPADRVIGGSSSGAICAFTVAWHRPDQFRNVISLIGSYTNIHGGHVYPELVLAADKKPIRIFLQDGVNDLRSPQDVDRDWYLQNQKMKAAFEAKGYDHAFVLGEGGHSDDHGGAILPHMLRWVWRDHPSVKQPEVDWVAEAVAVQPTTRDPFPGFDPAKSVSIDGIWKWERTMGRNKASFTLTFSKDGDGFRGELVTQRGDAEPTKQELKDIELIGNKVIFDASNQFRDSIVPVTYAGIVDQDQIMGWSMVEMNGSQRDSRWECRRQ